LVSKNTANRTTGFSMLSQVFHTQMDHINCQRA